jgi:hypothetical protein
LEVMYNTDIKKLNRIHPGHIFNRRVKIHVVRFYVS